MSVNTNTEVFDLKKTGDLLQSIFNEKNWYSDLDDKQYLSLYDRYMERLCKMTMEERCFILDLIKNFEYISSSNYLKIIIDTFIFTFSEKPYSDYKRIFIAPLIVEGDKEKSKSGRAVWYMMRTADFYYLKIFKDRKLAFKDYNKFSDFQNIKKDYIVVLVDDFIGTGSTAIEAVNQLEKNYGVEKNKIVVFSLVMSLVGKDALTNMKIKNFCYQVQKKGIESFNRNYSGKAYELIQNIEKELGIQNDKNNGMNGCFDSCETLVSMINTPNNTVSFFHKVGKICKNSPFRRLT